jgi:hypothetical protein
MMRRGAIVMKSREQLEDEEEQIDAAEDGATRVAESCKKSNDAREAEVGNDSK